MNGHRMTAAARADVFSYRLRGARAVYRAPVATGRDGFNTPSGSFAVYDKLRIQTMTGDAGGESWYVPDVPWVMYVVGGVALLLVVAAAVTIHLYSLPTDARPSAAD